MSLIHSHEEKGLKRLVEAAAPNRSWTFQDVRDVELGEDPLPSTSHDGPPPVLWLTRSVERVFSTIRRGEFR